VPGDDVAVAVEDPRAGDAAALIADLIGFLTALYPEDDEEGPPPWTVEHLARDRSFLVARVEGEAVACGGLARLPSPGAFEIVRMYVRPQRRGQRLADRVLIELEALARGRGAQVLMLRCGPRQPQALRLYARNGYVRRAAFAHHREHPTNLFYEKRLEG
jgi:putative acetyltransferase